MLTLSIEKNSLEKLGISLAKKESKELMAIRI